MPATSIDTPLPYEELLALPTIAQQVARLQHAKLDHVSGLLALLDDAAALMRTNPTQARQLATLCAELAAQVGADEVAPRATYLKAQTYALAGEFEQALTLIYAAREGYLALGQEFAALRTTAGLMHVLGESGCYQDALDAGQGVLDKIGSTDQPPLMGLLAHIQQNMGLCYNALGRYDEALHAYHAAETHYLALGMTVQAGDISNNRGILLWEMGRGTAALAALEKALLIREEANQTMLQAQTLSNMGSVYLLLGHYTASLETFERARRLFSSLDVLVDQHVLLLDTANAYLTLNLYNEAMAAYLEAAHLLKSAGVVHQRVRALWGLGATLLALEQPNDAEKVLVEAVAALESAGDGPTPLLATLLLELAAAYSARHHHSLAQTTAQRALDLVSGHDWPVPTIYAHLQLADLADSDPAQAESHLLLAQQLADPFGLPHLRYRLQQRLGRLRRQQGRREEAQLLLEGAIAEVERLRGALAQETLRTSFLHDKVAVYDELILLYLSWDNDEGNRRAFAVTEQAKSRTLLDLMTGVLETTPLGDETAAATQQQLQADLNAVYNELLNTGGADGPEDRYKTLQIRAATLEGAIQQLQLRLIVQDDMADQWATPLPLPLLQSQLATDTTLITYHIIGEEILAWVITHKGLHVYRALGQASEVKASLRRLEGMLDRLRASSLFSDAQMGWLELSARRVLTHLYQTLVAPLAPLLAETASNEAVGLTPKLTIVPHGCLHQVPFHALFDGQMYWVDRYEITYAPSATIYHLCQTRPRPLIDKALVVGVSDPSIPAVTLEVEAIAAYMPQANILLDEQATQANFRAAVAGCQLLHLACHGIFRADNPMFSALKLHDGWLTAGEAMKLNLPDALVTLSACESGRSQITRGDELLGLLRAFLGAGAATIVVSLWLAQDDTTARLMATWYDTLREQGMTPTQALRAAQLSLKAQYPHPYHWAPFIAVGRR